MADRPRLHRRAYRAKEDWGAENDVQGHIQPPQGSMPQWPVRRISRKGAAATVLGKSAAATVLGAAEDNSSSTLLAKLWGVLGKSSTQKLYDSQDLSRQDECPWQNGVPKPAPILQHAPAIGESWKQHPGWFSKSSSEERQRELLSGLGSKTELLVELKPTPVLLPPPQAPTAAIVAIDVETSDWCPLSSLLTQQEHFRVGCCSDHRNALGCICQIGWAVFRPASRCWDREWGGSWTETVESHIVRLPAGEEIASKAEIIHGLTTEDCADGEDFEEVIDRLCSLLAHGALLVAYNLPHECLAFCREFQKRGIAETSKAKTLMEALRRGRCAAELVRDQVGSFQRLQDAYKSFLPGTMIGPCHDAGIDAAMAGRIYLHLKAGAREFDQKWTLETRSDHIATSGGA